MSKTTDKIAEALQNTVGKIMVKDSFSNAMARMGFGQPNMAEAAAYPITRLSKNYNLMNSLYRNHWIIRRIIDTVAKDLVKNWIEFTSGITPEETDRLNKFIRNINLKQKLIEGFIWGRLYGGAAGLMVIEGDEDLSQPLDLDKVTPNSFKGLIILDRWSGIYPYQETVSDLGSNDFGLPEYYAIPDPQVSVNPKENNETIRIHHSRIVRFIGDELPLWEKMAESYWGASVVERIFDELKKRDNTSWNIASLVFLANLRVMKMADFGQLLSTANSKSKRSLYQALQAQSILMSNMGIYVMDKEDDLQTFQYSFSGLDEIYDKFMLDIAGAANIPATRLYGRSPAGMNSTGEGEETNYNNDIEQEQENQLRHILDKIFAVAAVSELGYLPDDIDFNFMPIETPSQKEIAEQTYRSVEAIRGAYTDGLISQKIGLMELKHLGKRLGIFTNITDEDIDMASSELQSPMDQQGGMFGEENPMGEEVNEPDKLEVQKEERNRDR